MPVGDGRVRYQLGDGELHSRGMGVSVVKSESWLMVGISMDKGGDGWLGHAQRTWEDPERLPTAGFWVWLSLV